MTIIIVHHPFNVIFFLPGKQSSCCQMAAFAKVNSNQSQMAYLTMYKIPIVSGPQ